MGYPKILFDHNFSSKNLPCSAAQGSMPSWNGDIYSQQKSQTQQRTMNNGGFMGKS